MLGLGDRRDTDCTDLHGGEGSEIRRLRRDTNSTEAEALQALESRLRDRVSVTARNCPNPRQLPFFSFHSLAMQTPRPYPTRLLLLRAIPK